ncbi:MAG: hypothetical protein ACRD0O_00750 [Acidimicrobiia bacterium]
MPTAVTTVPGIDEGWVRAVLFEHAIDDWIDLGPDPLRRRYVGDVYAQQVAAAYQSWKWLTDRFGTDIDDPPLPVAPAEPLALALATSDWTGLMAVLMSVGRAQSLLFGEIARQGDDATRRGFDRPARDCAGHAALGYLELRRGLFTDAVAAGECLARVVPATRRWLESLDAARPGLDPVAPRWTAGIEPLLLSLGGDFLKG